MKISKRPLVITQHGKSSAVMIDVVEYEALLEKIEILSDIHTAENQLREGKGFSHDEAKKHVMEHITK